MRLAIVILALAAVAVALVHIRRAEVSARHHIQDLRREEVSLRRELWDRKVKTAELSAPEQIRLRAEQMGLDLVNGMDANNGSGPAGTGGLR